MQYYREVSFDLDGRSYKIQRLSDGAYWTGGTSFSTSSSPNFYMLPIGTGYLSNVYGSSVNTSLWNTGFYSSLISTSGTGQFLKSIPFEV